MTYTSIDIIEVVYKSLVTKKYKYFKSKYHNKSD